MVDEEFIQPPECSGVVDERVCVSSEPQMEEGGGLGGWEEKLEQGGGERRREKDESERERSEGERGRGKISKIIE